jgi:hypothetical protein
MQVARRGFRRGGARLIATLWTAAVVVASLQSHRPPQTAALHRLYHFAVFAVTAVILRRSSAGRWPLLKSALAAAMLGAVLELLQTQTRYPIEWWDIRDDAIGAITGAVAGALAWQAASRLWGSAPDPETKGALEKAL